MGEKSEKQREILRGFASLEAEVERLKDERDDTYAEALEERRLCSEATERSARLEAALRSFIEHRGVCAVEDPGEQLCEDCADVVALIADAPPPAAKEPIETHKPAHSDAEIDRIQRKNDLRDNYANRKPPKDAPAEIPDYPRTDEEFAALPVGDLKDAPADEPRNASLGAFGRVVVERNHLRARVAELERERDELRKARDTQLEIEASNALVDLQRFSEEERALLNWHPHSAIGSLRLIKMQERAEAAERERDEARKEVERKVTRIIELQERALGAEDKLAEVTKERDEARDERNRLAANDDDLGRWQAKLAEATKERDEARSEAEALHHATQKVRDSLEAKLAESERAAAAMRSALECLREEFAHHVIHFDDGDSGKPFSVEIAVEDFVAAAIASTAGRGHVGPEVVARVREALEKASKAIEAHSEPRLWSNRKQAHESIDAALALLPPHEAASGEKPAPTSPLKEPSTEPREGT